jgi:hypothetical protein
MDLMILSDNLTLSSAWQYSELGEINLIKITPLSSPAKRNGLSVFGRYEIGQFNALEEGTNFRAIRLEEKACFFPLLQPPFLSEHILGIRLAPDFAPFTVKIEGLIMPVTNSSSVPKKVVTTQAIVVLAADTSKKILIANDKRVGISIRNKTNGNIALEAFDGIDFAAKNYFAYVPIGELYESGLNFTGDVWVKGEAGVAGNLDVRESVNP